VNKNDKTKMRLNTDKCMNTQAHVNTQPRRTWFCLLIILPVLGRGVCWASGRGVCCSSKNPFVLHNPFIVAVLGAHIASKLSTSTPGGFGFFILPSPPSGRRALSQICTVLLMCFFFFEKGRWAAFAARSAYRSPWHAFSSDFRGKLSTFREKYVAKHQEQEQESESR